MKTPLHSRHPHPLRHACVALLGALACGLVPAAPGAHGPDGEHLDEIARPAAGSGLPRIVAQSELFELVAELKRAEIAILVDRYETNEPVLNARLEVASGGVEAAATFRAEAGDYVVADPALLKALSAPGEHAVVFTLVAGQQSDLLDGTLVVAGGNAASGDDGHSHDGDGAHDHELERAAWIGAGVLALGLTGGIGWWHQRRRERPDLAKGAGS
jgi:hypothetical protein